MGRRGFGSDGPLRTFAFLPPDWGNARGAMYSVIWATRHTYGAQRLWRDKPPLIPPVDSSTSPLQSPGAAERWGGCAEKSSAQAVVLYTDEPWEPILRAGGNLCASSARLRQSARSYVQREFGHEAPRRGAEVWARQTSAHICVSSAGLGATRAELCPV